MRLPNVVRVRQTFPRPRVDDVEQAVRVEWAREGIGSSVRPDMQVAITAGSRGIAEIATVVRSLARLVREAGASPFIVPAMGSHGGATAEGQVEILASLGMTEHFCEAPIRSSMDVVDMGTTEGGVPVYMDRLAHGADGVIVANRIKAHTDFRGKVESGLLKMCSIGLGKHKQALALHGSGVAGIRDHMTEVGRFVAESGQVLFGLALIENAFEEPARFEAVVPPAFAEREAALLREWATIASKLPVERMDVLMVDRLGKNFSGTGMDTNVIGRFRAPGVDEPDTPDVRYIVVSDVSPESHGNAIGMGLADVTTRRMFDHVELGPMNENTLTSTFLERAKIPMVRENDRDAIEAAVRCNWGVAPEDTRLVRIPNTLQLEYVDVSENLVDEALAGGNAEVASDPGPLPFGSDGYLAPFEHAAPHEPSAPVAAGHYP